MFILHILTLSLLDLSHLPLSSSYFHGPHVAVFHSAGSLLLSSISLIYVCIKGWLLSPAPAVLILVQFLLGQVGSPQCWRQLAVQAGKLFGGMLNGFSIPSCGSTRGQRRELRGGSSDLVGPWRPRLVIRGRLHNPTINQCAFHC